MLYFCAKTFVSILGLVSLSSRVLQFLHNPNMTQVMQCRMNGFISFRSCPVGELQMVKDYCPVLCLVTVCVIFNAAPSENQFF